MRITIDELDAAGVEAHLDDLAQLLLDAHASGMAVGLAAPLSDQAARDAYAVAAKRLAPGERVLLGAFDGDELVGAVQLDRSEVANGRHRAEVRRLVVRADRRGERSRARLAATVALDTRRQRCRPRLRAPRLDALRRDPRLRRATERGSRRERLLLPEAAEQRLNRRDGIAVGGHVEHSAAVVRRHLPVGECAALALELREGANLLLERGREAQPQAVLRVDDLRRSEGTPPPTTVDSLVRCECASHVVHPAS
jgi:hypothetical protein